ncbi:MAG: hypothetical protein KDJ38_02575 [Gammaproteobacteria bacterium]|nr:hypothetical protein [Gammaproteobacteria bacterium]
MALTPSDELRLNVLLTQQPQAIKINESTMRVMALTPGGEARIDLHPDCKPEQYFKQLREFLSTQVLGSPGGYPIFLRRWTRMGQAREESLARLLLLAEDEAVTAVVHAPGLTLSLARCAWWVLPSADNARQMLRLDAIAQSDLGLELSEFLLEFLPFEERQQAMIDSVRLILQAGQVGPSVRDSLWRKASRKSSYYAGFLQAAAHELPEQGSDHPLLQAANSFREKNENEQNRDLLNLLVQVLGESGQVYLKTLKRAFVKPNDQDVVVSLMNTIGDYFAVLNIDNRRYRDLQMWNRHAGEILQERHSAHLPDMPDELQRCCESLLALSMVDETMVNPVFAVTDAVGSVMRKRIQPVTDALMYHIDRLHAG